MRRIAMLLAVAVTTPLVTGCTSFKSTMYHPGEGKNDRQWHEGPVLNGIPTTLRVLTHVRVDIVEHRYLAGTTTGTSDGTELGLDMSHSVDWLDNGKPRHSVVITPIETEKIVTIDPKRPLSGDAKKMNFTFAGQQVDKLEYQVDDDTIEDITTIVKDFFPSGLIPAALATQPTSTAPAEPAKGAAFNKAMLQVDATVASTLLELHDPDFECHLRHFLDTSLNICHDCSVVLNQQ